MEKSRREFLEESGFDVDKFELENEYSYKNILYAMEAYANYRIQNALKMNGLMNW